MCQHVTQQVTGSSLGGTMLIFRLPCRAMGRGFLPRKCVYGTRPVSAHPLGAIVSHDSACWLTGLGFRHT